MTAPALSPRLPPAPGMGPLHDTRTAPHPASPAAPAAPTVAWRPGAAPASGPVWRLRHTQQTPPLPGQDGLPTGASSGQRYAVRVLDNPVNTYAEVMDVCSRALGISIAAAFDLAHAIDTEGSCVVCVAARPEAARIAAQIATIGIEVRLEPAGEFAARS